MVATPAAVRYCTCYSIIVLTFIVTDLAGSAFVWYVQQMRLLAQRGNDETAQLPGDDITLMIISIIIGPVRGSEMLYT